MTQNVIQVLRQRGFIDAVTSDEIETLTSQPIKVYAGFDPTADSLHIGNLVAIMGLAWFQKFGHQPVALVGGATGLVGDPSGKSHERPLLDPETLEKNLSGITADLKRVLDFSNASTAPLVVNNYDWFKKFGYIEFLRDVGKLFRMGPMLSKDSVRTRLASEEGMSYTEFSYQLLQAYDFLHLYREHNVAIQLGGSDQWGNITAGIELVRRVEGSTAHGVTFPLLTRSDGKKFGKSEGGAIWLNPEKLSPYEFYQYFFRMPDADIEKLFKMLTFLDLEDIEQIVSQMQQSDYIPNTAQKRLAEEVTRLVHGDEGLQVALQVTAGAAPGAKTELNVETLEAIASDMPSIELGRDTVLGQKYIDVVVAAGLLNSKGEARRLIKNGGAYLNNQRVEDADRELEEADLIGDKLLLLGSGKKKKLLLRVGVG